MTDLDAIISRISPAQKDALTRAPSRPEAWFSGAAIGLANGNTLASLCHRGLCVRRSDPTTWGRSVYQLTELGQAIRQQLTEATS